jgi:hypothetical protein
LNSAIFPLPCSSTVPSISRLSTLADGPIWPFLPIRSALAGSPQITSSSAASILAILNKPRCTLCLFVYHLRNYSFTICLCVPWRPLWLRFSFQFWQSPDFGDFGNFLWPSACVSQPDPTPHRAFVANKRRSGIRKDCRQACRSPFSRFSHAQSRIFRSSLIVAARRQTAAPQLVILERAAAPPRMKHLGIGSAHDSVVKDQGSLGTLHPECQCGSFTICSP